MGDAGAQSLGYYTCAWSPGGDAVVAHGYTGALHLWQRSGQAPFTGSLDAQDRKLSQLRGPCARPG